MKMMEIFQYNSKEKNMNNEYKIAFSEVYEILNLLSEEMKSKISQAFLKFIEKNK